MNPEFEPDKLGGNQGWCSIRKEKRLDNGPFYYNLHSHDAENVVISREAYHYDVPDEEKYMYERSSPSPVEARFAQHLPYMWNWYEFVIDTIMIERGECRVSGK